MAATDVDRRNLILDSFAGHQEYSYSFDPLTSSVMYVTLMDGPPGEGGVGLDNMQVSSTMDETVYADSTDGETKTYSGSPLTFPILESNLADATHVLFSWDVFGWVFEFTPAIQMLSGRAVRVTPPSFTFNPDGTTTVGMTDALRMRFHSTIFMNSSTPSPLGPGSQWDLCLFNGDPFGVGVEVGAWDYVPIRVDVGSTSFSQDESPDPFVTYYRPPATKYFPRCQSYWGSVTHWGWKDVAATPTIFYAATFDTPVDAVAGTEIFIEPDALSMTFGAAPV